MTTTTILAILGVIIAATAYACLDQGGQLPDDQTSL
jgi:hypothetical protein